MKVDIDGNDLVSAVASQRNEALDAAANNAATIQALLRTIAEREKKIVDLEKKLADAAKPADA